MTASSLLYLYLQIDYFNNKVICDLVEMQHSGMFALLDEACFIVGTVTDMVCVRWEEGDKCAL